MIVARRERFKLFFQQSAFLFEVYLGEQLLDRFRAHSRPERAVTELLLRLAHLLVVDYLLFVQIGVLARIEHDELDEVKHEFHVLGGHVEHEGDTRRDTLEIPDMRHGRGELDVTHSLAAHLGARDFHAALVADDTLISYPLIFSAMALPVLGGSENALAEQTVFLRLLRPVIYRFGLGDFAVRPGSDLVGGSNAYLYAVKIVYFGHTKPPYSSSSSPSMSRSSSPRSPSGSSPEPNRSPKAPRSNSFSPRMVSTTSSIMNRGPLRLLRSR